MIGAWLADACESLPVIPGCKLCYRSHRTLYPGGSESAAQLNLRIFFLETRNRLQSILLCLVGWSPKKTFSQGNDLDANQTCYKLPNTRLFQILGGQRLSSLSSVILDKRFVTYPPSCLCHNTMTPRNYNWWVSGDSRQRSRQCFQTVSKVEHSLTVTPFDTLKTILYLRVVLYSGKDP